MLFPLRQACPTKLSVLLRDGCPKPPFGRGSPDGAPVEAQVQVRGFEAQGRERLATLQPPATHRQRGDPMDYYYSPMACSLVGHALIREAGLPVKCIPVSLRTGQAADGSRLGELNAKTLVPVLRLADGRLLSENFAVLSAIADLAPGRGYLPPRDSVAGLATLEWLSFTATEIHKLCLYPIFQRNAPDAVRSWSRERLAERLAVAAARLGEQPWLAGDQFTLADAYLGWALMLCPNAGVSLEPWPPLQQAWQRWLERPAFAQTVAEERQLFPQHA